MAPKKESEGGHYKVGDHIRAKLNDGRVAYENRPETCS